MGCRRLGGRVSRAKILWAAALPVRTFRRWRGPTRVVAAVVTTFVAAVGLWASLVGLGILDSPFAASDGSEAAMRREIASLEAKVDRLAEYLADLPSSQNDTLRAAYEEGRLLQLEGYAAQDAEKHAEAIERFSRAIPLAETDEQRAALYILRGNSYLKLGDLDAAEDDYVVALDTAVKITSECESDAARATALCNLGILYFQLGDLDKAEELYKEALAGHEKTGDRPNQAQDLGNLANVYLQRGDLAKAEEDYNKAVVIHQQIGDTWGEAADLCNIGIVYAKRGDLDSAEQYFKKALDMHRQIGSLLGQANALGNLGETYRHRGELDEAEAYYQATLAIQQEIGDQLGEAQTLASLGLLAEQRGDAGKARILLNQAKALYEAIGAGGEGPDIVGEALERLGPE